MQDTPVLKACGKSSVHNDSKRGEYATRLHVPLITNDSCFHRVFEGDKVVEGTVEGTLEDDKTQTSTLTVANPQDDEVYTCLVTSGKYTSSAQSAKTVKINTFG